ncbi:hypothetical protein [Streptomyces violascens]|uniref:Uncharacterized protein n=1 Tax=Streptomyces violascens TaxID=67381 RepID=A0ABQ3QRT3_9ACTN|nr:hypothetical protein [Streptomyces violascens]GHI39967.1 hypothetical protein Sviol_43750 [Streptomyces violascens]
MAFECGVLGHSAGQSPRGALTELLHHLQSADAHVSYGDIKEGEGWAAARFKVSRPTDPDLEQYVQVSIGGEILEIYLEDARAALGSKTVRDKNLMLTTILSGETDPVINRHIIFYALAEWHGIPWDETSGFTRSEPAG